MGLFGLAFLEGFALIISPCILPILPIILSGSLEGSKKRPLGIVIGFVILFAVFTFFSRKLVQISGIDLNLVRNISFGLLLLLGIIMLSTYLTEQFTRFTRGLANIGSNISVMNNTQGGFISGFFFGGLVGFIWTPCAGPILAAVIVQSVLQTTTFSSFLVVLAFGIGAAVPMLVIALLGRKIMNKFSFFKNSPLLFRKLLGVIIIASVAYMIYGNGIGSSFAQSNASTSSKSLVLMDGLSNPYPAPPVSDITAWINSKPLLLNQLKGKVVLIDFWAYSCINCVRTIPYLNKWYQTYHDKGFTIIGVHSPEFDFERDENNVKNAVEKQGIRYPVALDNHFQTWQNYNNSYWPAHYLIDKNGNVVYQHFGEGQYDVTENNIRYLLGLNGSTAALPLEENFSAGETPETYLGYERANNYFGSPAILKSNVEQYHYPDILPENAWALRGKWTVTAQKIIATEANAAIKIHFRAGKVFAVMGSNTNQPVQVKLLFNGELLITEKGKDVINSNVNVRAHTLYQLIELKRPSTGIVELIATTPGLTIYTFTFGD